MIKFKKIGHDVTKYFPKVIDFLKKDSDVVLAYLFGSYGKGKIGPLSDVDIAVLFDKQFSSENYFDKQLQLMAEVCHILHTDEVDVIILNQATPTLAYSAIQSGKVLYCQDELEKTRFETQTLDRYLDTKKIREEYFYYFFRRIKEGKMTSEYRQRKFEQSLRKVKRMP